MMTVQEIVTRVRAAIDELIQDGADLSALTTDEQNMTRIIADKIPYALQHVIENAPVAKLDTSMLETLTPTELQQRFSIDSDLVGTLKLPADLLRIVEARLSSWSLFPIPEPSTSQVYLMQQDPYARGSYDRPVNIITHQGSDRVLEMYCAKEASDTLVFLFVRKPSIDNLIVNNVVNPDIEVDVPTLLEAALVYQVAALTMVAYKEDLATSLFAISQRYMNEDVQQPDSEA